MKIAEYCATFLFVLFLEQHRHFGHQILSLATGESLKHYDLLASTSPFYHRKSKLVHIGGRIGMNGSGRRDRDFLEENSTHYKLILPQRSQLTQLMILNMHQRNRCCSPAFTRLVLKEHFYCPRATSTIKTSIKRCPACLLARNSLNKIEPPTGNVKAFRLLHSDEEHQMNKPYRVAYYDFKGPIKVNDDRQFKSVKKKQSNDTTDPPDEQLKVYILSMTCALTRNTTLAICENRSYESAKLALLRIFYERRTHELIISDQ